MPLPPTSPSFLLLRAQNQSQHCIFILNTRQALSLPGEGALCVTSLCSFSALRTCLPLAKAHRKRASHLVLLASCPLSSLLSLFHPRLNLSPALRQRWAEGGHAALLSLGCLSNRLALFFSTGGLTHAYTIICSELLWIFLLPRCLDLRLNVNWKSPESL